MIVSKDLVANFRKIISSIVGDESIAIDFNDKIYHNFFFWNCDIVDNLSNFNLPRPYLNSHLEQSNIFDKYRAVIDLSCCYYLFCDQKNYLKLLANSKNQELHNQFEKIRVILLGANQYFGFAKNIAQKIDEDLQSAKELDILPLFLLDLLYPKILSNQVKKRIEITKNQVDAKTNNLIISLLGFIDNQTLFFQEVSKIIDNLSKEEIENKEDDQQEKQTKAQDDLVSQQKSQESSVISQDNHQKKSSFESEIHQEIRDLINNANFPKQKLKSENLSDDFDFFADKKSEILPKNIAQDPRNIEFIRPYKVFTTKFDEVILPTKIIKKEELDKLKEQLLEKFKDLKQISKSVELKLKKKLLAKKDDLFEQNAFEGVINRKKLTQLIINPLVSNILINKSFRDGNDVAVSILLDNSGSMRGKPIIMTTLACQILAEILEKFLIKTEIIGYTTGDWKGGRVKKLWEELGKEKSPGRLNELRHIIYKDFKHSFKSCQDNLALMLKEGLLKENIDGEAIIFAVNRLSKRVEKRKILLVISDGNPIDDATNSANDGDILLDHLQNVVTNLDKRKNIELASIAIGYSGNNFYKNSVSIKDVSEIGDVMLEKVLQFL